MVIGGYADIQSNDPALFEQILSKYDLELNDVVNTNNRYKSGKKVLNANIKQMTMKYFLSLLLILVFSGFAFPQVHSNKIDFKGGRDAFVRKIMKYLDKNNGGYNMASTEMERMFNKYFVVVLNIDKRGRFYDHCSILSMQDTTNGKIILAAFRQTDGDWINNTGYKKTVIIPVYFIYISVEKKKEKDPMLANYYYSLANKSIVCLEPLVIEMLPGVR